MQTLEMFRKNDAEPVYIPEMYADGEASGDSSFVSEEEYWEKYYIHPYSSYEWNCGHLEERPMTDGKGWRMYHWFAQTLEHFLSVHPIAETMGLEFGFRLSLPRRKTSVRKPDLSVIRCDNPVPLHPDDQSFSGTLDMCIESLSYSRESEILRDTVVKKKEYQNVKVREYFILDARMLETVFYRLDAKGKYRRIVPENGDIIHSEVLPGFRFRISDLTRQPSLEEMAHDRLYQDWILPFYQKIRQEAETERQKAKQERLRAEQSEKKAEQERMRTEEERLRAEQSEKEAEQERLRAEQAEKKAEQERCKAEQERIRAEHLAARLRKLGIDPELSEDLTQ